MDSVMAETNFATGWVVAASSQVREITCATVAAGPQRQPFLVSGRHTFLWVSSSRRDPGGV